ncbi:mfs peptide transporter [Neofusicoccum parvum]|uniref:Putative peptide transporter ptr2-a protein n=1 Tax=Botryosphaeria parva (strain UCR-NP2) TaxID=1287680 RepID=R1EQM3_BOTPV|nr:putative peptide transporter ptr2-a protein [Neofusicoccum parvum UCRNP2]GME40302.1 mfs peptide transporter [Neofusicoccum parvum]
MDILGAASNVSRVHHDRSLARRGPAPATRAGASGDSSAIDAPEVVESKRKSLDTVSDLSFDDDEPTEAERQSLRHLPDSLPWSASLIAVVELCERFAYYGLSGPFQNYMANKYHDPSGLPGAIGLGQHGATLISSFFQFWCYLTPVFGAVVADQYLGKYWTIVYFSIVYMAGIVILFLTSLPSSIEAGYALPGLLTAILVIGLGTGGIKSNVSPLIAEQYEETKQRVKILPSGERVIVDPALTIQRIYMVFYMCINIGSLSAIATSTMELRIGFWAAYLLPLCMFVVGFVLIVMGKNKYVIRPPSGSVIANSFKALYIAILNQGDLDAAKPSLQRSYRIQRNIQWDDAFVEELKRALLACKVFCFYPIYWAAFGQMSNNFISQAGQMQLHGIPNDIMQNIDPFAVICLIPLMDRYAYPFLRRRGFAMKPITRITFGFLFAALAMAYAAFLQHTIYASEPCFDAPSACAKALRPNGSYEPNHVHVVFQTPAYLVMAVSEILASVTGLEYAFMKAPASMKSFIMALYLLTTALGAMIGGLISPFARDPLLMGLYGGLALACLVTAGVFWKIFKKYNDIEDESSGVDGQGKEEDEMTA